MCWLINLEKKNLKLEFMDYKKYSSFTFIDPTKNIFGFTLLKKYHTKTEKREPKKTTPSTRIFEKDFKRSVDHYQHKIEDKDKSKDKMIPTKQGLNMTSDLQLSERRNSTSSTGSSYKNQLAHSHRKQEYNKTTDFRHTITGDSFKPKY